MSKSESYFPERSGQDRREHECSQIGRITGLEVTTQNIEKTLVRQEATLEKLVSIFEHIAGQNQQILNIQASIKRNEEDTGRLTARIEDLELWAAGTKVRIGFIMAAMATASSVATTLLMKFLK